MARHPNQHNGDATFRVQSKKPKSAIGLPARETKVADLKALEAVQATRPAKPPGRR